MAKDAIKKLQQQLITASDNHWFATTVRLADEYLQLQPDSIKAMLDKGHALVKLARYEAALSIFETAIEKLGDQSPDAIYGEIGNLYRDRGDFARAAEYYNRQIEGDPNDATGRLFLGTLQFQQGDFVDAEKTLRDGLACEIGCEEELRYALGCVLRSTGQLNLAKAEFEEVLRITPKDGLAKNAVKDLQGAE
jgi:tetratricopeptide (TPR) repeat protein